jgi:hypothetical protein
MDTTEINSTRRTMNHSRHDEVAIEVPAVSAADDLQSTGTARRGRSFAPEVPSRAEEAATEDRRGYEKAARGIAGGDVCS